MMNSGIPAEMQVSLSEMIAEKIFYTCFEKTFHRSNLYSKMALQGKYNTNQKISELTNNFTPEAEPKIELHQDLYDSFDLCLEMWNNGRTISQQSFIEFVQSERSVKPS